MDTRFAAKSFLAESMETAEELRSTESVGAASSQEPAAFDAA
jgi:hypothetical protein